MRVLVVEDEDEMRGSISRRLRGEGFPVDEASDVDEARRAIGVSEYDCLVLDRVLPGGDALDLLAELRKRASAHPRSS